MTGDFDHSKYLREQHDRAVRAGKAHADMMERMSPEARASYRGYLNDFYARQEREERQTTIGVYLRLSGALALVVIAAFVLRSGAHATLGGFIVVLGIAFGGAAYDEYQGAEPEVILRVIFFGLLYLLIAIGHNGARTG